MDFSFTEDQLSFKEAAIEFAKKKLNDDMIERDRNSEFSMEGWKMAAEFGAHGLPIPEEYGGLGLDLVTTALVMEGLGYGCRDMGLLFSINAHIWSSEIPILIFGTDEQKSRYLPKLVSGEFVGVHAITEPDFGSDAFGLRTRAELKGDKYVLNGSKTFITNGSIADLVLVFATVDRTKGLFGITCFIVEKSTPGFTIGKNIEKMGLRTSPISELVFEDCEIPVENRLGKEGAASSIFNTAMEYERAGIFASSVGSMERQLEECIQYCRDRRQFDRPIGKFQSISNKIAEMKIRLEASRLLLYKVAWMKDSGQNVTLDSAIAKVLITENHIQSSLDAIQIHGGYGYSTEYEIERDLRDAVSGTIYSGTTEIQKNIIARLMKL